MSKQAIPWLKKFCALYARHDRSVYRWEVDPHVNGALITLTLDRGKMFLLVHPKNNSASYANTKSLAISIHQPEGTPPMPGNGELVIRQFISVLDRADKGDIVLPSAHTGGVSQKLLDRDPVELATAHEALADELHWGEFLAYRSIITEDLYPHVQPLGRTVGHEQIRDGWKETVRRISEGTAPSLLGLYLHIPFCTVACSFCYCAKTDQFDRANVQTYLKNLHAEINDFGDIFGDSTFTSVYFGGGTPSLLTPPALRELFATLYGAFHVPDGTQVIFEGNPDSLSAKKIEILGKEGKVTRLTIGVQTLDDHVQALVRRFNKPEHVKTAVESARANGIKHVNCDLMAGMPEQTMVSFQKDVQFLLELNPDSIHLNGYRPLPRTRLAAANGGMSDEQIQLRDEMLEWATNELMSAGHSTDMGQGLRRTRNAANIQEYDLRRQNSSLLGLGFPARSHSFGGHYYSPDASDGLDPALQRDLKGGRKWHAIAVDDKEERHKYLVSNLRTGFTRTEFQSIFGMDPVAAAPEAFEKLGRLGVVHVSDDEIYCKTDTAKDDLVYRTFFYSEGQHARAREVWGSEYDRSMDYKSKLTELVESCS
jgi:oxygen-independent coproporphyrinogen III oxidase